MPSENEFPENRTVVITIMKLCDNMADFKCKFERVFSKMPVQYSFDDIERDVTSSKASAV